METVIHGFVNKLQHCEFAQTQLMATRRHLLCGMNTHMTYVSPGLPFAESQLANTPVASLSDAQVRQQLLASTKKTEHLTEVLRESEANSMRLADQAKLLKEEIRRCVLSCMQCACFCTCWWCCVLTWLCLLLCLFRLERNKDREESVSNMEYLKNVILKVCMYCVHMYVCVVCTQTSNGRGLTNDRKVLRTLVHRGVFPPPVPAHNWPRTGTASACNHLTVEVESAGKGVLGGSLERCVLAYSIPLVLCTIDDYYIQQWEPLRTNTEGTCDGCVPYFSPPSVCPR